MVEKSRTRCGVMGVGVMKRYPEEKAFEADINRVDTYHRHTFEVRIIKESLADLTEKSQGDFRIR